MKKHSKNLVSTIIFTSLLLSVLTTSTTTSETSTKLLVSAPSPINKIDNSVRITDPTRGLSKANRLAISFEVWLSSPTALKVIKKESRGNCRAVSKSGKYRGKWQMDARFWKTYGGLKFAAKADLASCEQQDEVAFKGWLARGWQPWGIKG